MSDVHFLKKGDYPPKGVVRTQKGVDRYFEDYHISIYKADEG